MSLAGLMSGAECAVEVNPLSQVLKHTVDGDRSLQQVRSLLPYSPYILSHILRTGSLVHPHQGSVSCPSLLYSPYAIPTQLHHLPSASNNAVAEHDMAMARQFFDSQQATGPGPSFSPAQMPPMQDLMSRQLQLTAANRGAVLNMNDAWADIQRNQAVHSMPHNAFPSTGWASEFSPAAFAPGPTIQQNVSQVNCASENQSTNTTYPNVMV